MDRQAFQERFGITGKSPAIRQVIDKIMQVSGTDITVLLQGETGVGKDLTARAIHSLSKRNHNNLVIVNCGAIPEGIIESELFGHEKGAFTDARDSRVGRFEIANGGTLFLDEIGNLPLHLQPKLLSALQTHKSVRIGSNKPIDVDIRLICATNEPLKEMVSNNTFRQDLLYRFNTIEIHLPPLRERNEDIALLADHFLNQYKKKYKKEDLVISENALAHLKSYHWPGNIRELEHAVERAVILSDEDVLSPGNFLLYSGTGASHEIPVDDLNLEEIEKTVIQKALEKHQGNISRAADDLGLTRTSLYRRMEKYEL